MSPFKNPSAEKRALGFFAVGHFAVGEFTVRKKKPNLT